MNPLARLKEKQRLAKAYADVFESESGRMVLVDLARRHGVLASSYLSALTVSDGIARALAMAHSEGERNVVLSIIQRLHVSLDDLIREAQEEEARVRSFNDADQYAPGNPAQYQ